LIAAVLSCSAVASAQALRLQTLHQFAEANPTQPVDAPILASDGNFYGTISGIGLVFQRAGCDFQDVARRRHHDPARVAPGPTDGALPVGSLIQSSDGNLYGVAVNGGIDNNGVVYRLTLAGDFASSTRSRPARRTGSRPRA
jgi:uncharacterized repeat protein (TIGR03803 family)